MKHRNVNNSIFSDRILHVFLRPIAKIRGFSKFPIPLGMNRMASGESETETYDELSNLITKGTGKYVYQDKDQANGDQMRLASVTTGTQYNYTYDANGNPTIISNKFTSLAYDNLNLLRQIVYAQTDRYWYNTAGLRVKKTENATGTWKTTYTLFDGDNPLMQEIYTSTGRIQVTFNIIVNGKILAQYKRVYPSTTTTVYFYLDHLNSRRVVVNSSKAVIDRYRYSAWGVVTQDVGTDDYRSFTGKDYNASGLIYFNARYYDPVVGRFVTEDPARKGTSWYTYCENDPVNRMDPRGQQSTPQNPIKTDSPVYTIGLSGSFTMFGPSAGGNAGMYFVPKQAADQELYTAALSTSLIPDAAAIALPLLAVAKGLAVLYIATNTAEFGFYGTYENTGGGAAIPGSSGPGSIKDFFSASIGGEIGRYESFEKFKGLATVIGGSGSSPAKGIPVGGGADIYLTPSGRYNGVTINAGAAIGATFEGHVRTSNTGTLPLFSSTENQ